MQINDPITSIKGIGESTAQKLSRLKINTVIDLLRLIPRRYLDYSKPQKIECLLEPKKNVVFVATINEPKTFYTKSGKLITQSTAEDQTGKIKLIWFNNPYIKRLIRPGTSYTVAGQTSEFAGQICLISPTVEEENNFSLNTKGLVPIYPQTQGLKSTHLRKYVHQTLNKINLNDPLKSLSIFNQKLSLTQAYRQIHFPQTKYEKKDADQRLSFNEHLKISLNNQIEQYNLGPSPKLTFDQKVHTNGQKMFPFKLTESQIKATSQIVKDLTKSHFTHRLVQGDTGSGKTATIILAANQAIAAEQSCAILAPTQILANQHFSSFKKYSLYPEHVTLITSQSKPNKTNKPTIYIGTHSLLNELMSRNEKIIFFAIDEQHKFGVDQRDIFSKQANPPHIINLSATPIPRTVAQGLLGEISISTIKTKPTNRLPIKTNITNQKHFLNKGIPWLINNLNQGTKAFIVAPNIHENEISSSVESLEQKYKQVLPNNIQIFTLHGKIKPEEQNQIINNFISSPQSVLISTSLIEVGIDIASANIMIIHSAERFGLAQLHQLRGRVGRGSDQGYCLLIPSQEVEEEVERLNLLTKYNSGLTLAKKDLILRGSGEVFGSRQHGLFQTRLKYFWSRKSYLNAKTIAKSLTKTNINEAKILARELESC